MKINIKSFFLGSFLSITSLFLLFFLIGKERIKTNQIIISSFMEKLISQKGSFSEEEFKECLPNVISYVPFDSSIIIGHAYGRGGTKLTINSLSPKVNRFLKLNKNKINTLFLTGDIFNVPSLSRYKKLYDEFEDYFDIYIAPGNHEVDGPLRRDLFDLYVGEKQPRIFPFYVKNSEFFIVVDDSNLKKNILNSGFDILQNNLIDKKIIFLRHHVLINELSPYGGKNLNFYNKKLFEKNIKTENEIFFIYGNGGMYKNKPRIACFKHKNFTHILNGIGEFNNDNILIIYKGNIFRYILKN